MDNNIVSNPKTEVEQTTNMNDENYFYPSGDSEHFRSSVPGTREKN